MKAFAMSRGDEFYDSRVEKDFAENFMALDTGWKLIREPEVIPVGKRVMIPDFGFRKGGLTVYLEVIGFWTPEYLRKKIQKLKELDDVDMIVAANKNLACQKLDKIAEKLNVIYYKQRIPLRLILVHLKAREERLVREQTKRLSVETLPIQKPVVGTKELAEKLGILEDAVRGFLAERKVPGYTHLGDMLIKETKLKEIQERLENRLNQGDLNLIEASRIVEDAGGIGTFNILQALDYNIEWHGIDPQSTNIRRKKRFSRR